MTCLLHHCIGSCLLSDDVIERVALSLGDHTMGLVHHARLRMTCTQLSRFSFPVPSEGALVTSGRARQTSYLTCVDMESMRIVQLCPRTLVKLNYKSCLSARYHPPERRVVWSGPGNVRLT